MRLTDSRVALGHDHRDVADCLKKLLGSSAYRLCPYGTKLQAGHASPSVVTSPAVALRRNPQPAPHAFAKADIAAIGSSGFSLAISTASASVVTKSIAANPPPTIAKPFRTDDPGQVYRLACELIRGENFVSGKVKASEVLSGELGIVSQVEERLMSPTIELYSVAVILLPRRSSAKYSPVQKYGAAYCPLRCSEFASKPRFRSK